MFRKRYLTTSNGRRGAVLAAAVLLASCSGGGVGTGGQAGPAQDRHNSAPVAANPQLQAPPASSLIIRVLETSTDRDGDNLRLVYVTQPAHGVVTIEDNGTPTNPFDDYLRYVCDATYVGTIRFQYTISDGSTGRATGTVEIVVGTGGNNPPYAIDDAATVAMNVSLPIDVLANDSDPDGDVVAITAFSPPTVGAVVHDTNGTPNPADDRLVYTPLTGYVGLDSFTYTISDGDLTTSAVVSVEVGATGPTGQVCGTVTKGALQAALIQLFPIDDTGTPTSSIPVAQALTDVNGNWCAAVPLPRVPMLVRSLGGQFIDETDTSAAGSGRRTIVLNPDAFLETALMPSEDFISLNVYTNAILEATRRTAALGGFSGVFPVERELYRQAFGWTDDLVQLEPANPASVDPAATEAERLYAMALGGIANVINEVAVRFGESQMTFEMIHAIVIDLTDCLLDGHYYADIVRTPVEFDLNGTPVLLPDNLDLNLSILRFRNNSLTDFGGTPLAQINGGICLGTDADDDSIAPIFVPDPLAQFTTAATGPLTNLLAVVPTPLAVDNFDPSVDVQAIAIATDTGTPVSLAAADVPPGEYDMTWEAVDDAGNTTQRVQRIFVSQYHDGSITQSPDSIVPGAALTISVDDPDLDIDTAAIDTVDVTVTNLATTEVETVTLTETGISTGVFTNTLATRFGVSGADDDGTLDVQAGEIARASYDETHNAAGLPGTVTDDTTVTGGVSGAIVVMPDTINPGGTLTITVTDADLDTNAAVIETVDITVTNTTTAEVETVTLTETGVSTGIFSSTLATLFGVSGIDEDGTLEVQAGQTARGRYDDALIASGDSAIVTGDAMVTGGADGTIDVTPDTLLPGDTLTITVTDADLDANPTMAETVDITVSNTTSLELETVTLTETGVSTGIFSNTLTTQYGDLGTDEDGMLDVQATDLARGSYDDVLTLAGNGITVFDDAIVTGGSNGTIDIAPASFTPGDALTITVTDLDLDTDPALIETVDITVTNTTTLELETVTLTETDINTAIFSGTLATVAGTGGGDNDGMLEIQTGEAAQGAYPDNLASTGAPVTRTDTSFTTVGETDLRLMMTLEPPSTDTVQDVGDTVDLRLTLTNDGPVGATNTTVRIAGRSGVVMLGAVGDGSFSPAGLDGDWTLPALANGASATTVVTVRIDGSGLSAYHILAEVFATDQGDPDSTAANGAAAEDDADTQTILLVAEYPYVWTGNVSTSVFDPGNWLGGATPPPGARVIVPTNVFSRYPIIPGGFPTVHLGRLAISAGAFVDMSGVTLEMTGSLIALGPVIGHVWSHAGGFRAIEGTMSSLAADADMFVSGSLTVIGDLDIIDDHVYLDGQIATVGGDFTVTGDGHFVMQVGGDMTIAGDALFDGGGHNHPMTAGFLRLQGNLAAGSGNNRFIALPGHTTLITGGAVAVEFQNGGRSGSGGSHFGDIVITDASTVDFRQSTHFAGQFTVDTGSSFGITGGSRAHFETAFPVINGTIVPSDIDRFRLIGPIAMAGDETLYPGIKLIVARQLTIGPHTLTTTDDLIVRGNGSLVMNDPGGVIDIGGDFLTESDDNHTGLLTAGTVTIAGDFSQTGNSRSYAAAPGHVTRFGGGTHRVYFESANSGFGDLLLAGVSTIQMDSNLRVSGQFRDAGILGSVIHDNDAAFVLTTAGVDLNEMTFDGVPVTIGDGTITGFDNIRFTAMNPADDQLTINQTAGIPTFVNIDFDTLPTTGTLLAGNDIGGAAGDAGVTIDNSTGPARPLHGTPWSTSAGGFVINWGNPADDSDGDGLGDADEGFNGSNPLLADTDGDSVGDLQEFLAGSDPVTADAVVFVDPNAIAPADGNSWATAWRNLAQADAAGDLVTTGAIRFVLIAEVTGATGAEWQVALDGTVNNCDNLVVMGSLGDGIWLPQDNNGAPVTHLTLGGAGTGSVLDFEKCAGVQLHDLRITGGIATEGGAIRLGGSSAALRHLHLTDNVVSSRGGGLAVMTTVNGVSAVDLDDVLVADNGVTSAPLAYGGGGGIYVDAGSGLIARRAVVTGNGVASALPSPANGGGGIFVNGGAVDMADSALSNNKTDSRGAGLFIADRGTASGVLRDSIVSGNSATGVGGGAYFEEVTSAFELTNNIVSGNSAGDGGGIAMQDVDAGGVFNNTIVYNQTRKPGATGAAIYAFDTPGPPLPGPAVADNILRGNIDEFGAAGDIEAATVIQSEFNITEVGVYGPGDLMADPLFESGYYLTQATSPAVDHDTTRDATARSLETRMTDVSGTPDNNANLDAGYHYGGVAPATVASILIDEPAGNLTGASPSLQAVIVKPHDAGGNALPAGLELIIDNTSIDPVTVAPITDAEPLGAGNGVVMTDLGDGRYLIRVDTSLVPAGTFTADIIVNRAAPQGISIGIL